jgi:hypothetical protein
MNLLGCHMENKEIAARLFSKHIGEITQIT